MISDKTKKMSASQENNRPKIQDILLRKDRKESLFAKIMGPRTPPKTPVFMRRVPFEAPPLARRAVAPRQKRNISETFSRSLLLGREGVKKFGRAILLKKNVVSKRSFASFENFRMKELWMSGFDRISGTPLFFKEARKNIGSSGTELPIFWGRFHLSFRFLFFLAGVSVAGAMLLFSVVFARATISLEPSAATLSFGGIRIEAGAGVAEIDSAGKKIPAFLIETAGSLKREFSSSAKERVSRKSSGVVRIYNAFNASPQILVVRTRLQDSSGRIFRIKQRVIIPGAAIQGGKIIPRFVSVGVEADRVGEEYNIGPARFAIPGFSGTSQFKGFYAESQEVFAGGFEGEARIVSQQDIDAASEEVTAALFAQLKEELERKIPSGATGIQGAREITVTALQKPKAGEVADRFTVEADGSAALMLLRLDDIFILLGQIMLSSDAGKNVSQEKSRLEFDRAVLSLKDKTLSFEARGQLATVSVLNSDEIRRAVIGKTRVGAENILRADSRIRAFGVGIFPPWRRTIPSDGGKIRVLVRK